ncbi:putative F-box/FBD/LRR-repeat protein At4g13965 [Nicotiana sylvestris]|uniref:putative F-box/FBD/LRR-repeat protein At4g13965 n=1 Tax=Nicotiana sylvestris TaxID=4096 RepID=UPI00388C9FCD
MEAPDLISSLPDKVLCSIISFLPTKEAIATSVYSKRWRFLWKSLSRLSFDLSVVVDDDGDDDEFENHWRRFLRLVELNEYVLRDASPFKGCVNIRTLKFTACIVSKETLIDTLGNCEFLKNLGLRGYNKSLKNLSIQHKEHKLLEIHYMSVGKFYLLCENLTKMVFKDFSYSSKDTHCPKLQVLKTNNPKLLDQWCTSSTFKGGHGFEPWKQPPAGMHIKAAYDRLLWSYLLEADNAAHSKI